MLAALSRKRASRCIMAATAARSSRKRPANAENTPTNQHASIPSSGNTSACFSPPQAAKAIKSATPKQSGKSPMRKLDLSPAANSPRSKGRTQFVSSPNKLLSPRHSKGTRYFRPESPAPLLQVDPNIIVEPTPQEPAPSLNTASVCRSIILHEAEPEPQPELVFQSIPPFEPEQEAEAEDDAVTEKIERLEANMQGYVEQYSRLVDQYNEHLGSLTQKYEKKMQDLENQLRLSTHLSKEYRHQLDQMEDERATISARHQKELAEMEHERVVMTEELKEVKKDLQEMTTSANTTLDELEGTLDQLQRARIRNAQLEMMLTSREELMEEQLHQISTLHSELSLVRDQFADYKAHSSLTTDLAVHHPQDAHCDLVAHNQVLQSELTTAQNALAQKENELAIISETMARARHAQEETAQSLLESAKNEHAEAAQALSARRRWFLTMALPGILGLFYLTACAFAVSSSGAPPS